MNKQDREQALYDIFNKAVGHFQNAARDFAADRECLNVRTRLLDLADEVLLSRDSLGGAELTPHRWDSVIQDVADVCDTMQKAGILMMTHPVETSTGRKTYRVLNKPRFDA